MSLNLSLTHFSGRNLGLLLIVICLISALGVPTSAQTAVTELSIGTMTGKPGDTVDVPVMLNSNTATAASSYAVELEYDSTALEVSRITNQSGDYFDSNYNNDEGWLKAVWVDSYGGDHALVGGDELFIITFKIKADATNGVKNIGIESVDAADFLSFTDANGNALTPVIAPGFVLVSSPTPTQDTYTVSFETLGGSSVTSVTYITYGSTISAPVSPSRSNYTFSGWYKDVTVQIPWSFDTDRVTGDVTLYAKWNKRSSSSDSSGNSSTGGVTDPSTTEGDTTAPTDSSAIVLINGKQERIGNLTTTMVNGQTTATVIVDPQKLNERLAQENDQPVIIIPFTSTSDIAIGQLSGQAIQAIADKQGTIEIQTPRGTYTVPAAQINANALSHQLNAESALDQITVQLKIAVPNSDIQQRIEAAAAAGNFTLITLPVEFGIIGTFGTQTAEVSTFNNYVKRSIVLPNQADPSSITTAIVLNTDGTVRHVPTRIVTLDGKVTAHIQSLTNSTYAVIYHPVQFDDVSNHWAQAAVNNMGSRMIIEGIDNHTFNPNRSMTRAEFATILVRGLGLKPNNSTSAFADVQATDWYHGAVQTASAYGLITGFADGTFHPNVEITREQAMTILAKAMKLTGLAADLTAEQTTQALAGFQDGKQIAGYAQSSVAQAAYAGILSGRDDHRLAPKASVTRAEVATLIQRLLEISNLI